MQAIWTKAPYETRLSTPVASVAQADGRVEVHTRAGETIEAGKVVVAVPLNALGGIEFDPPLSETKRAAIDLGQASRGVKIFIHARGEPVFTNGIKPGHPFGYLDTEIIYPDGTQLMIGFGYDQEICDASDLEAVQRQLDDIIPGYEAIAAYAHDWLADEFSRGTWAIHRPGWYTDYHAEMQRPEGNVLLAGSDFANGWAGFMDGAIESGLKAGAWALSAIEAAIIPTERLVLVPLQAEDADELCEVLDDDRLHEFTGDRLPSVTELHDRFVLLAAGSPREGEDWLNWVVRRRLDSQALGTVQATMRSVEGRQVARLGWMIGIPWQGKGYRLGGRGRARRVGAAAGRGRDRRQHPSRATGPPRSSPTRAGLTSDRGRIRRRARVARLTEGGAHAGKG